MPLKTADEWEQFVGKQLKASRLRQNMRQEEVASRAQISSATLARLESGSGSTLASFIKVLKVLREDGWLEQLAPEVSVSPLQVNREGVMRLRARKPKRTGTGISRGTATSEAAGEGEGAL